MTLLSTEGLARACSRRPWRVVGAWIVLAVLSIVCVGTLLGSALSSGRSLPGTDFARASELLVERLPEPESADELVVVRSDTSTVDDPSFREQVEAITREIDATGVAEATNAYENPRAALVSDDKTATTIGVKMLSRDETENEEKVLAVMDVVEAADGRGGLAVDITGAFTLEADRSVLAEEDLQKGEFFFGAPMALVIMVLVFGALVGAFVPLIAAVMGIILALAIVALTGQVVQQNMFIVNMLTGMGLALGIDYSLFILARYREERSAGREKYDAIAMAGATSSRAVFFSGVIFVFALLGMLLVPDTILRSLASGAIFVGITSLLCALTFTPALLGLLGDRVNALRVPFLKAASGETEGRFWSGVASRVMRRPVISLALAGGLLVAATVPVLDIKIRDTGIDVFPDKLASKQGFVALEEEFPDVAAQPADVVVNGDVRSAPVEGAIERLQNELERAGTYGPMTVETNAAGDLAVLSVPLPGAAESDEAVAALKQLRNEHVTAAFSSVDAEVVVGGATAEALDASDIAGRWLPIVIAFVLGLSFIALTVAFRSLVVPAKAIVLNLLSVGAAYGLIVLVFQKGVGADLLGFQQVESVESWVPAFLFSVLFGLSMDYHVFLVSRIRERFGVTRDNTSAVAYGVGSSARLITGAALIMVAVFTGFAIGDLVMFQQMGFGLAVALIIDATIVRSILLPATMKLLGERNWYLPRWLEWLPDVEVEGPKERPAPTAAS